LASAGSEAREVADARKQPHDAVAARQLVEAASTVYVGRGQKFLKHKAAELLKDEEALAKLLGPTGNLRAPTLRLGKTLVVGYSEPMYSEIFG
jgi:hypothetical protein